MLEQSLVFQPAKTKLHFCFIVIRLLLIFWIDSFSNITAQSLTPLYITPHYMPHIAYSALETVPNGFFTIVEKFLLFSTERVSLDLMEKSCSIFLTRSYGGSCPYRKLDRRNAISIYISIANSFTSERAFFVTKLPSAIPNSLPTATALSLECRPAKSGISPPKL